MFKAKTSHLLALIPVALALVVGVMQIYLAFTQGLSAWQVGGFGMFARPDMKYIRVYVGDTPFEPSQGYDRLIKKIDTLPIPDNLELLVTGLACEYGKVTQVELWRGRFDVDRQGVDFWLDTTVEKSCE